MRNQKRRYSLGFTLVEVLVVMAIIALLAGLVVGSMAFVREKQDREKAKIQIALLSKAIEDYKADMGAYPGIEENTPAAGEVSDELYQALFKDGYDYTSPASPPEPWTKATKIYLSQLDPRDNKQGWVDKIAGSASVPADQKIKDPWGNEYRYRRGTNAQNPDFDLWSAGKDGKTNAASLDHEDNKDDIRNN